MNQYPNILWLNTSFNFAEFDRQLIDRISSKSSLGVWQYRQNPDEGCSLDIAVRLLHHYLALCPRPIHLIGHSTAGLVGLLYARKYPQSVKSLTLLSVGVHPAVDWQAHYYVQRQLLSCDRKIVLHQMVHNLFGNQPKEKCYKLVEMLEEDLEFSPSPHSLYQRFSIAPQTVPVPLLVCGVQNDVVIDRNQLHGWSKYLKGGDRLWVGDDGRHFFHHFYPDKVESQITQFWESLPDKANFEILV
ncbi:alpha/beta hydrolase [Oscillatoriales cyanobacterium LEGE 11467]|uniref:Alpha/beta hydrolase n=1 Tax=Zarconia navalis LEGE 11467 TaxID=1828826 RepID=A0A928Z9N3_9CYAN|nr:alpha/beta hydrolase [Zarconia navalis]MBE9041858.1 alpha/beta hydrolase [Zarconia navalis LEGE 11467]